MRAASKTILALVCLAASTSASAGSFDDVAQPAVYFTVKFGGKRPGLKAPRLDARLDYTGVSGPERPLAFARPALLDWQMDGEGTAVSLSGLPLYARSWQASLDSGESRGDRVTKSVLTGATITVLGVGVALAAVNAFMKDLGDGLAQGMDQAMSVPDDGSGSSDSGNSDSGNGGSICVGTICPTGGGG